MSSALKNKTVIDLQDYNDMDNLAKIEALKTFVPKIQGQSKLFPLFKINSLKAHSMSYHHYFNLYRLAIGLVFIQAILTLSTTICLQNFVGNVSQMNAYWIEFGLVLGLGIPVISFSRYRLEKKLLDQASQQEEQTWTQDKFSLVMENWS
jgi:hypothetical protein